jgi:hypothetical protein
MIYNRGDVERFLHWISRLPNPVKEAYRLWSLRILDRHKDKPVYWYEVQQIKEHIENCSETARVNGIRRAKEHFEKVQKEMDSGLRCDTRPTRAQTAPPT